MTPDLYSIDDPLPHQLPKNRGRYSMLRALARRVEMRELDGLEAETNKEIATRAGKEPNGFYLPLDIKFGAPPYAGKLARAAAEGTGWDPTFLETLGRRSLAVRMGARILPDAVGMPILPRVAEAGTAHWVDHDNPATMPAVDAGQMTFSPRTVLGYTDVTRTLLLSYTMRSAEQLVFGDLAAAVAGAIDRAAFAGEGGSTPQPTGLIYQADIPEIELGANGAALARSHLIACEKAVTDANENLEPGALAFVTSTAARAKLRATEKAAGSGLYLWGDDDRLLSYPAHAARQMPATLSKGSGSGLSPLIFGHWPDALIALWGACDLQLDPYTFNGSKFRIRAYLEADIQSRHAGSFVRVRDIVTS